MAGVADGCNHATWELPRAPESPAEASILGARGTRKQPDDIIGGSL